MVSSLALPVFKLPLGAMGKHSHDTIPSKKKNISKPVLPAHPSKSSQPTSRAAAFY